MASVALAKQYGLGLFVEWKGRFRRQAQAARKELVQFKRDAQMVSQAVGRFTTKMGEEFGRARRGMMSGTMTIATGAAIAAPYILASKAAAESEDNLAAVKSLLVTTMDFNEAEKSIDSLRDRIFSVARTTRIPMADLEKSSYDLVSANLTLEEAMGALDPTQKLAVAGMGSMADATNTMTGLLNTYGKAQLNRMSADEKANYIGNILSGTIAAYKTTLPKMTQALAYSSGVANSMGVELAELTATIGALQTVGLEASRSGTSFNAFIRESVKLIDEHGESVDAATLTDEQWTKALERGAKAQQTAGLSMISVVDKAGKLRPIYDILAQIEERFGVTGENARAVAQSGAVGAEAFVRMGIDAKYAAELQKVFGEEGSRVISMLLGQSQALKDRIEQIKESEALDRMFQARMQTLAGQFGATKNKIREFIVTMGEMNVDKNRGILRFVDSVAEGLTTLAKEHPELASFTQNVFGLVGGLTALGGVLNIVRWAWTPLISIISATGVGLAGLIAVVALIGGLFAYGIYQAIKYPDEFWDWLTDPFVRLYQWLKNDFYSPVVNFFKGLWYDVKGLWNDFLVWTGLREEGTVSGWKERMLKTATEGGVLGGVGGVGDYDWIPFQWKGKTYDIPKLLTMGGEWATPREQIGKMIEEAITIENPYRQTQDIQPIDRRTVQADIKIFDARDPEATADAVRRELDRQMRVAPDYQDISIQR